MTTRGGEVLSRLRQRANVAPYYPVETAPDWLDALAQITLEDPGVLVLLGPVGLTSRDGTGRQAKPKFDPATLFLVGLADRLRRSSRHVSLAVPPAARHLPLLFAAAAVLATTIETATSGQRSTKGVLLISPDLELRSRYTALQVGKELLDSAHPGSRMRPDGTRAPLNSKTDPRTPGGVCFFLPPLNLPPSIDFDPALIILDLRYARWSKRAEALSKWAAATAPDAGVLAIYTFGDTDTQASLRSSAYLDFPMDHAGIETCEERVSGRVDPDGNVPVDWSLAPVHTYLDRSHRITEVPGEPRSERLVGEIAVFLQQFKDRDTPDLRRARFLLAALMQMPVPLLWYEEAARAMGRLTLKRMIGYLGSKSRFSPDLDPAYQTLRIYFDDAYNEMSRDNPKSALLIGTVTRTAAEGNGSRLLVVVRDEVAERAVKSWFEVGQAVPSDLSEQIDVCGCPGYERLSEARYRSAVVCGAFPRRYSWIAGAALADTVEFLTYPRESDIVARQLAEAYDADRRARRIATRRTLVKTVLPRATPRRTGRDATAPALRLVRPESRPKHDEPAKRPPVRATLEDLKRALDAARQADEQEARRAREEGMEWPEDIVDEQAAVTDLEEVESGDVDDIECIRAEVSSQKSGAGYIWLPLSTVVEFVRPGARDVSRVVPSELRPGDVLLRMDDGRRSSLFDRIVELAEGQPEMQYLAAFRAAWRSALRRLAAKYSERGRIDFGQLLRDLQANGAPVETELAIRWWIADGVIGPERVSSIVAVGRVAGVSSLVARSKEFDRAFRRIRGIRQGIGRRLSHAIRRSFDHLKMGAPPPDDDLDIALGLPLEELLESVDLVEVVSIDRDTCLVPAHLIDRFRRSD